MTRHDMSAADLVSWLDHEAQAPIPEGELGQTLASIASRRPRPERLAWFGSHWIDGSSSALPLRGSWRVSLTVVRSSSAILLLLLTLALIGVAVLIGSRLFERHFELGRLAYGFNGDIYLADWDGRNPTRVANGAFPDQPQEPRFLMVSAGSWAPDGRHFLYYELVPGRPAGASAEQVTAHISDADGRVVASVPGIWVDAVWSPDSTRVAAWADSTHIGIYGIDGVRQALIPVPRYYARYREDAGKWALDGRSVVVRLGGGLKEFWELPIDGSTPHRLAEGDPRASFHSSFTRDGSRVAIATWSLTVANSDGTDRRVLEEGQAPDLSGGGYGPSPPHPGSPGEPIWSPDETHVLYVWSRSYEVGAVSTGDSDLRIADVATGTIRTLIADLPDSLTAIGWSPAGDRILFSTYDNEGRGSLWTVNRDGSGRTLLVEGSGDGSWQWIQRDAR
jgi:Tol biopolymer transport system component